MADLPDDWEERDLRAWFEQTGLPPIPRHLQFDWSHGESRQVPPAPARGRLWTGVAALVGALIVVGVYLHGVGERHPPSAVDASLARAAKAVSFAPEIPRSVPPGFALAAVGVDRPPEGLPNAKKLTTLILTYRSSKTFFTLSETAVTVSIAGARQDTVVLGRPLYVSSRVTHGVTILAATVRIDGVSYSVTSPGSLTLSEVEQVLETLHSERVGV